MTTIGKGEVDLLQRSSGVGRRTAERIVLELKDKLGGEVGEGGIGLIEADSDILEALMGLGYRRERAKDAVKQIDSALVTPPERLRDALEKIRN